MKKPILKIVVSVLSLSMIMPISAFAYEEEKINDPIGEIVSNLKDDEFGGVYIKDGVLHIKPLEQSQANMVSTYTNSTDIAVVFDDAAEYSVQELRNAQDKAIELFDSLDIDYVAIDDVNNGLAVGIHNLDEEKERIFKEYVNIENISFENVGDVIDNFQDVTQSYEDNISTKAAVEISSGVSVADIDQVDPDDSNKALAATIGASVYNSSVKYFVSTAHGTEIGDRFTYNTSNPIGTVNKRVMSGSKGIDVALIKLNENNAKLSSRTIDNNSILTAGAPVTGNTVYIIIGNTPIQAKIKYASCTKSWDDSSHNDVQTYKNIMMMEPSGTKLPEGGDSGSAVVTKLSNGAYNICGIYKGRSKDSGTNGKAVDSSYKYMFATRWDVLSDYFNIDLY